MHTCTRRILPVVILIAVLCALLIPQLSAADSLTRGTMFTVSIAGKPNTAYYVWFTRTFAMSGEPGDQPPVIVGSQYNVEFDPDGGPYVIGSYRFNNGNGRTILDDVAPSAGTTSSTRYYAKVTTDAEGVGIVQFSTSSATAARTFPIRAENPASPGQEVAVALGLPAKKTTAVLTATPLPATTTPVTVEPIAALSAQSPAKPEGTATPVTSAPVATTAIPVATTKAPVGGSVALAATALAFLALRHARQ